jgi:hypothetical protein
MNASFASVHCYEFQLIPFEPDLDRLLAKVRLYFVGHDVMAIDRHEFGV